MRAAVYHGTAELYVENVPDPSPQSGEVVLEIHATGICGTDAAEFVDGPFQYPSTSVIRSRDTSDRSSPDTRSPGASSPWVTG